MSFGYLNIVLIEAKKYLAEEHNSYRREGYLEALLIQKNALIQNSNSKNKTVRNFSRGVERLVKQYSPVKTVKSRKD